MLAKWTRMKKITLLLAAALLPLSLVAPVSAQKLAPKTNPKLSNPAALKEKAPAKFKAKFETTKGTFVVEVTRAWSPNGADRFYNLVKNGFYDNVKFFRVVPGFVVQFGIHGDPAIATKWLEANIPDDIASTATPSNTRGFLTYAKSGQPNSRSTQLFINLGDNARLDAMGFTSFGKVISGMEVVEKLYGGYTEQPTQLQGEIAAGGNAFLNKNFPKLDMIKTATLIK